MAMTVKDLRAGPETGGFNDLKYHIAELSLDATYAAGGYTLTAADYQMSSIVGVIPIGGSGAVGLPVWNRATGKLMFMKTGTAVSSSAATGQFSEFATNDNGASSSIKYTVLILGISNQ